MKNYKNLSFLTKAIVIYPLLILGLMFPIAEAICNILQPCGLMAFAPATVSSNQFRQLYTWLKQKKAFADKVVTEGYLQMMVVLGSTQTINFNFFQEQGSLIEGENRLTRSDSFFAVKHGFAIGQAVSGVNVRTLVPEYFPNVNVFPGSTELAALKCLYGTGKLNIKIGSTVYYDNFPIWLFEESQNKEQGEISAAIAGPVTYTVKRSNVKGDETALRELTPHIFFNGLSTNEVSVKLSSSVAMTGESSAVNYAIYRLYGYYINNGAIPDGAIKDAFRG